MTIDSDSLGMIGDQGLNLGPSHPPIDDQRVARAMSLIDASGICARVARWREEDRERAGKGPGGRPASLDDRMILVIMLALVLEGSPTLVTHAATATKYRLSDVARSS